MVVVVLVLVVVVVVVEVEVRVNAKTYDVTYVKKCKHKCREMQTQMFLYVR